MERWLDGFAGMPRRSVRCHLRTNPQPIEIWLRGLRYVLQPDLQPNVVVLGGTGRYPTAQRPAEVRTGHVVTALGGTGWHEGCVTTDQEVGGSSPSGRAAEVVASQGVHIEAGSWTI
jgi:hypothetical protein